MSVIGAIMGGFVLVRGVKDGYGLSVVLALLILLTAGTTLWFVRVGPTALTVGRLAVVRGIFLFGAVGVIACTAVNLVLLEVSPDRDAGGRFSPSTGTLYSGLVSMAFATVATIVQEAKAVQRARRGDLGPELAAWVAAQDGTLHR